MIDPALNKFAQQLEDDGWILVRFTDDIIHVKKRVWGPYVRTEYFGVTRYE